ncbi:12292_t:CDS:10, partial [Ambispora leptoticha]
MISQLYILSVKGEGETLLFRDYRDDTPRDTPNKFNEWIKEWHIEKNNPIDPINNISPPSVFHLDGVQYLYININESDLYLVCTTRINVSPFTIYELLGQIAVLIRDFCGSLKEESLIVNSDLIYELVDEVIDYGYPQTTSTDQLINYVHEEPVLKQENILQSISNKLQPKILGASSINQQTKSSSMGTTAMTINNNNNINRSVISLRDVKNKNVRTLINEVYIDVTERVGMTVRAEIEGSIQIKSYLTGNRPELRIGLNSNILSGDSRDSDNLVQSPIVLDDYLFHESVVSSDFEKNKNLVIFPPHGEFTAMIYRISNNINLPFRIFPLLENPALSDKSKTNTNKMDVLIRMRSDFPKDRVAKECFVWVPLPRSSLSVSSEFLDKSSPDFNSYSNSDQSFTFDEKTKKGKWVIRNFEGGTERTIRIKVIGNEPFSVASQLEVGPISLEFNIQNYTCSKIQIRRLKVYDNNNHLPNNPISNNNSVAPQRW